MKHFSFESVDESYYHLVKALLERGQEVSPRGMLTKELTPVSITIENPRKRVISHPVRKLNYGFMVAELLWILRASNSVSEISHYNRQLANFTDDGETLNGAYGQRIFRYEGLEKVEAGGHEFYHPVFIDQFQAVIDRLKSDPESRHGTIVFWDPKRDTQQSKDLPCTNMMRFIIRGGRLNMITFMRSNDVWFGYPYDVFNFTMLQEIMAGILDVGVGTYTHVVDSFHLYEMHFDKAKELIEYGPTDLYATMEESSARIDPRQYDNLLAAVQRVESVSRGLIKTKEDYKEYISLLDDVASFEQPYWTSLAGVIFQYNVKKLKDDPTLIYSYITNEFHDLVKPKEEKQVNENNEKVVDGEIVEDNTTTEAATENTTAAQEQQNGIQKIAIETDGTLENTKILFDDQPVPMLVRVEFLADVNEGVVMRLGQIVVDEEGNAKTDEEGKMVINTFTISRQQPEQEREQTEDKNDEDITAPATDQI